MRAEHLVAVVTLGISVPGCAMVIVPLDGKPGFTGNPSERQATFQVEEYAPYAGKGNSGISGQVVIPMGGGKVAYGARSEVLLNPRTRYSTEWFERCVIKDESLKNGDIRADTYSRTTTTDSEGRFRFDQLRPGEYYLACRVTSGQERTPGNSENSIGGERSPSIGVVTQTLYATVKVGTGELVMVVVTR
jgi:hypothetical protein